MGGMLFGSQGSPTVVGPAAMYGPFAGQFVQALGRMFGQPLPGVTPLEQATVQGAFQAAQPQLAMTQDVATGKYLPGQQAGNPFLQSLQGMLSNQADVARRQMEAEAQRSGMTSSSDYMRNRGILEGQIAGQQAGVLAPFWQQGLQTALGAQQQMGGMGQQLLSMAGLPRQVAQQNQMSPFQMGLGLLEHMRFPHVIPGQNEPGLLSAFAPFLGGGTKPWFLNQGAEQ